VRSMVSELGRQGSELMSVRSALSAAAISNGHHCLHGDCTDFLIGRETGRR
jgi:hypothetical protein